MIIIKNIKELATCRSNGNLPVTGKKFSDNGTLKDAAIVIKEEKIIAIGKTSDILNRFKPKKRDGVIDALEQIAIPGFVDCHTHAVYAGSRAEEYEYKLRGLSYAELQKKKGGIHFTAGETRKARESDLLENAKRTLQEMLKKGTTTVEIKSGYGLTLEDELKILRVINRLKTSERQEIISTFFGAHTIPTDYKENRNGYVELIIKEMLPRINKEGLAEFCDVFCDALGFTPEETKKIFIKARKLGFKLRIHAEQTSNFGGAQIASELKVISVEHGDFINDADIKALKKSGTTVVFLPGVTFHLMEWNKVKFAELVNKIKKAGIPIALASDYNPGSSPILSMKLVMDLGLRFLGLNYQECLNAVTINSAHTLDRSALVGSIEKNKRADILLIDAPSVKDYIHQIGDKSISRTIVRGEVIGNNDINRHLEKTV